MDNIKKSGKYGLVFLPKTGKSTAAGVDPAFELGKQKIEQQLAKRSNVFGEESSSEERSSDEEGESGNKAPKKRLPPAQISSGSMQQRQAMQVMKKALEEDSSIYEYDEIYDGMQETQKQQKEKLKAAEDKNRKPKYIENLLKTAARRQREHEARVEREVQKEREKEGDEFQDKEEFVTSAYRKKMEELERLKAEEERQDSIDALTEVTKQKDLSGFYRHLYRTTVDEGKDTVEGSEPVTVKPEPQITQEDDQKAEPDLIPKEEHVEDDSETLKKDQDVRENSEKDKHRSKEERDRRSDRDYDKRRDRDDDRRRRTHRSDEDDNEDRRQRRRREEEDDERRRRRRRDEDDNRHTRRHRGDDRDRRHDTYHSRSSGLSRHHERDREYGRDRDRHHYRGSDHRDRHHHDDEKSKADERDRHERRRRSVSPKRRHEKEDDRKKTAIIETKEGNLPIPAAEEPSTTTQELDNQEAKPAAAPVKPKTSIWEKRTVGPAFEEAMARYLERKGTLQVAIVAKD